MSLKSILGDITRSLLRQDRAIEENKRLIVNAPFSTGRASQLTIVAGEIAVARPHILLSPETGTTDNLDTINNGQDGKFIILATLTPGDTITVRDMAVASGNIDLHGSSYLLDNPNASLFLYYVEESATWHLAGIPRLEELRNMDLEAAVTDDLIYKKSDGEWGAIDPGTLVGGSPPAAHATSHQHGGGDEVATATPAANAIPKADASGTLNDWITAGIGNALPYKFDVATSGDPGSGHIRLSNVDLTLAFTVNISDLDINGTDMSLWLSLVGTAVNDFAGYLHVWKKDDPAVFHIYGITSAAVDNTTYWSVGIIHFGGNGTFSDEDDLWLSVNRSGDDGVHGADTFPYNWLSTTSDSDPLSGNFRGNNATFASITKLFIDDESADGVDMQAWLATFDDSTSAIRGHIKVTDLEIHENFMLFDVNGASIEAAGYWKIAVTPILASGTWSSPQIATISFVRAGDAGDASDIAAEISAAATDDTIADADLWGYVTGGVLVKTAWSNIKAVLKTYLDTLYVALTGAQDIDGDKTFISGVTNFGADATVGTSIGVNGAVTNARQYFWRTAGVLRWSVRIVGAESGSNAGGNLEILRRNDDGSALETMVHYNRATGYTGFGTTSPATKVEIDGFFRWSGLKRVSTQFDKTNTTLATVTGLSVTVEAGKSYKFVATLFIDASAAGGHKVAIAGTATATAIIYHVRSISDATNLFVITSRQTALGGSVGQAGATAVLCVIEGLITVNAAGTLLVQFAQNASSGTSSVIVGSTFEVLELA